MIEKKTGQWYIISEPDGAGNGAVFSARQNEILS